MQFSYIVSENKNVIIEMVLWKEKDLEVIKGKEGDDEIILMKTIW